MSPLGEGWFARIHSNGEVEWNKNNNGDLNVFALDPKLFLNALNKELKAFAKDPATFAAQYGKRTGKCCFCDIRLTDDRDGSSVEVGYGPICAKKWNLPHLLNKVSPDIREMMLNEDIPLENRGGGKPKKPNSPQPYWHEAKFKDKQIAKTIWQQMTASGGIKVMSWGTHELVDMGDGLKIKVNGRKFKGNVIIVYDRASDYYKVLFGKIDRKEHHWALHHQIDDVGCEELVDVIDEFVET